RFTIGKPARLIPLRCSWRCWAPRAIRSSTRRGARIYRVGSTVTCAAFEFIEGVPKLVIPDNPRTGVDRACRYEPDLNRTYHEMAQHYGVAILPTRPYKPRDKAKVEVGVQVVQRWIVAALRHQRFGSVAEVNEAISALLTRLN